MSLLNGRAMVAGKHTAANEIINLSGAVNAIDGYDGYKMINDEAIVAAKPDVVLSIQRSRDTLEAEAVYAHPGFALTPVVASKAFISMEGLYLLGFGPRTAAAARDLSVKLYPSLAPQAEQISFAVPARQLPAMTAAAVTEPRSADARAPVRPSRRIPRHRCLLVALVGAARHRTDDGRRRNSPRPAACRAGLVDRCIRPIR